MLLSVCLRTVRRHLRVVRSMPATLYPYSASPAADSGVTSRDSSVEGEPRQKLLRAAVLGTPNAGKTTLVNQLLGRKVGARHP